jgi:dTDP-4-dehydrorhamnose reductase
MSPARAGGYGARVRRLFVTGLGGHLGSELGRRAPAAGWEVAGIMGSAQADVRDGPAMIAAVGASRPDVVVHTAYRLDDPSVNVEGTRAVAAAAVAAGARLVHISSDVVFPGTGARALTEDDEPRPVTPYGTSKLEAERLCPPDALIVRTSLIYGGPAPAAQERMALDVADGVRDMAFFTDELRCPIAVADLAAAVLELAELGFAPAHPPPTGPLHVAGADVLSRLDFARLVCRHHGRDPKALRGVPAGPDRPKHLVLDCSRARALLRVPLRGAREVLAP